MQSKLFNFFLGACLVTLAIITLIYWQSLLVPFVIAIVLWYFIITLSAAIAQIPVIGTYIPGFIRFFFAIFLILTLLWLVFTLVTNNITQLISVAPSYQQRLVEIKNELFHLLGLREPPNLTEMLGKFDFVYWFTNIASTLADLGRNVAVILIYLLFLLLEYHSFPQKMASLIKKKESLASAREMVTKINQQIQSYVKIKTFTSILTGTLSYSVLVLVGVDFATFWGLLIFFLNFIPTIGSIIATIFPCILTLIQFNSFIPFIIVTILLTSIQFFVGNFLEPKMMGRSFNLSPLAIIVSLSIWGTIWGIVGMFLCVPIMVIMNIVFANFSSTRPIAILLSESGEIKH